MQGTIFIGPTDSRLGRALCARLPSPWSLRLGGPLPLDLKALQQLPPAPEASNEEAIRAVHRGQEEALCPVWDRPW